MGEVYRARDSKLGREVAIKVLPEAVAQDGERLQRFEREAKALAALNHPRVATLYGMEADGDTPFLVMEVVEGPTLAERIAQGRLSFDEALPIFLEIAEALEAAHDQGIVHRDLKPANVKLSPSGVKVLDFGLAKALAPETPTSDPTISHSPTLTLAATERGEILGTAAYMSPEQAQGEAVDQRADVWAFGACLYEALTGRRAFEGENASKTLAAILMKEVDLAALRGRAPASVVRLVDGCLQKEATDRLRSMGDLRLLLAGAGEDPLAETSPPGPVGGGWLRAAVSALVAAAITGGAVWWAMRPEPTPLRRFPLGISEDLGRSRASLVEPTTGFFWRPQISPDGSQIAFVALREDGETILMRRSLDSLVSEPIAGTEGASFHFFSPDGRWLAFFAQRSLWKISLSGGAPVELCPEVSSLGGSWEKDDTILFAGTPGELRRVRASGGGCEVAARIVPGMPAILPQLLPDGEHALVTTWKGPGGFEIGVVPLDREEPVSVRTIVAGSMASLLADGTLLVRQSSGLVAGRLDTDGWTLQGATVEVAGTDGGSRAGAFGVSSSGSLVYLEGAGLLGGTQRILRFDLEGSSTVIHTGAADLAQVRVAPQGDRIVYQHDGDLWVSDLASGVVTRLTFDGKGNGNPEWMPGGEQIVYRRRGDRGGSFGIMAIAADGAGGAQSLLDEGGRPGSFTPDGEELVFSNGDLWVLDLETGNARALLERPFALVRPALSPDGRWLAYTSYENGQREVFVRPYPEVESGRWQVSAGGHSPTWSKHEDALFYVTTAGMMTRVAYEPVGSSFRAQAPVPLFELSVSSGSTATTIRFRTAAGSWRS